MKYIAQIAFVLFTLSYGSQISAQQANVQKLSENVYSAFLLHYQSLIVIGDKGVLITDPANTQRATLLKSTISKLTSLPVTKIVLSHEHYDHVGGTEVFPNAEIYAHQAANSIFRLDVTGQAPKTVHHYVGDNTKLVVGKTTINLLHFGAADGVGMIAVHLPNEQVVYSADLYEVGAITQGAFIADTNYLGSRKLLNALVSFGPKYAITAHSKNLDPKHLQIAADFYNDLFNAVEPALQEAMKKSADATMSLAKSLPKQVKLPKYRDLGNYSDLPQHVERMVYSIFHGG
ncbi:MULTISPECIES: MBL fold metallo-hydrolase [Pseudoalteromonas]|uniref:MBL fold metallo-hydrolase n=1 Tax=Pseudoalteromonas obscura TaxID=3048491 RepID=A0ABT7EMZ4_9GAMM|nr:MULTISPECIES: MBL fold metallo-hydrolase [Pseudoalteromonas]MBQ4838708.1 MBL fold metallo-hydrolase [Pseudoalteromonas luteoviolacea]MDK2596426.1 MBL fold metallo-hydrolase [Pseudoalteromonas sp. P94(2023)]